MYTPLCPLVGQGRTGLERRSRCRTGPEQAVGWEAPKAPGRHARHGAKPLPPLARVIHCHSLVWARHAPICPSPHAATHTSAESGAVNSKTQKNLRTSQCVWNRNLEPRRYRTNCVTAAAHCGTGTWDLRHSSRYSTVTRPLQVGYVGYTP